ncbi:MAG: hypothetical protein LBR81_06335 [Prevotellaceae bacterium]|nr:hypothetical protein [Prevotellaceae bacterium]
MDAGNLIYIGIFIAVILINVVGWKAKKSQQENTTQPHPTPAVPSAWEELMRELNTPQPKPSPVETKQMSFELETIEPEIPETYSFSHLAEQKNNEYIAANPVPNEIEQISTTETGHNTFQLTKDELQKAVIYAEILNRKYS